MDLVYPIGSDPNWEDYQELKYSLRSVDKNLSGVNDIYIVGELPEWATNVHHIEALDPYTGNKDANMIQKIVTACINKELSEEFLRMADDYYVIAPTDTIECHIPWRGKEMRLYTYWESDIWHRRLWRTFDVLNKRGLPTYNYEGHIPYVYNKYWFPQCMMQYDYGHQIGYTINSLYFNTLNFGYPTVQKKSFKQRFTNSSGKTLTEDFKQAIKEQFPHKCKYEL